MTNNPAVLPDARALKPCPFCGADARRFTIGEDEPNNAGGDVIVCTRCQASSHVEFGYKENLDDCWNRRATPPASDAAVPAGEGFRQALEDVCNPLGYLQRRAEAEGSRLGGMAYAIANDIATVQRIARDALASAPKVASGTGAGLAWEALEAVCEHFDGTRRDKDWWETERLVRAALATPTDATDGATGGGEEWTFTPDEREKAAILSLCADQDLSPTAVMRQALRLYQHDHCRRKDGETVKWSGDAQRARDFAGSLATTPGADLLEQAAGVADAYSAEFHEKAAKTEDRTAGIVLEAHGFAGSNIASAIRALNTAGKGEGGE